MLRSGVKVQVEVAGGEMRTLEIGRILLKDQEQYEEMSASFDVMLLLALANSYDAETDEYDMDKMAFIVNAVFRVGASLAGEDREAEMEAPTYTPADCAGQIEMYTSRPFPEEMRKRMSALVALVLSRKHPEITAEDVDAWLDLTSFLAILRAFYQVNHGIRERF